MYACTYICELFSYKITVSAKNCFENQQHKHMYIDMYRYTHTHMHVCNHFFNYTWYFFLHMIITMGIPFYVLALHKR